MPNPSEYNTIRINAAEWIRTAGEIARERFGHAVASRKADRSVVTDADYAVQEALLDAIARDYPADAVISEETQPHPQRHADVKRAKRCWIVDPIDGTRNYSRAYPSFAVAVALMEAGSPVVGFVYEPMTGQLYSAAAGGGAWLNDTRIQVVDEPLRGRSIIGMPSSRKGALNGVVHDWIDRMIMRNAGTTALHLAYLACGAMDAVYCDDCKLWDIAAGFLLVAEAGGRVIRLDGAEYFPMDLAGYTDGQMPFLAAAPGVLNQLCDEFNRKE